MPKLFRKARGEHKETNVSQRATIAVKLTLQVSPSPESIWLSHPAALAQVTRKRLIPETVSKALDPVHQQHDDQGDGKQNSANDGGAHEVILLQALENEDWGNEVLEGKVGGDDDD
mmetsp:Transcript_21/g.50  ORF Transcript_21/g.50 Transcript_21/m.50 type:complete len:116 (+) Transcript_21:246-593(+)